MVDTIANQIKAGRWKAKRYGIVRVDDSTLRIVKMSKSFERPPLAVDIKYDEASDYYKMTFYQGTNIVKRLVEVGWEELNDRLLSFFYGERGVRREGMREWLNMQMPTVYRRRG
jgi:hypothetical protein